MTSRGTRVKNNYQRRITLLGKALRLTLQKLILDERRRIRQICIAVRAKKILWWERERESEGRVVVEICAQVLCEPPPTAVCIYYIYIYIRTSVTKYNMYIVYTHTHNILSKCKRTCVCVFVILNSVRAGNAVTTYIYIVYIYIILYYG